MNNRVFVLGAGASIGHFRTQKTRENPYQRAILSNIRSPNQGSAEVVTFLPALRFATYFNNAYTSHAPARTKARCCADIATARTQIRR